MLLVDLDPHGSLTSYFGLDPDVIEPSAYDLFMHEEKLPIRVSTVIQKTKFNRLHFIPASSALATLDRQLGTKGGMGLVIKKSLHEVAEDLIWQLLIVHRC